MLAQKLVDGGSQEKNCGGKNGQKNDCMPPSWFTGHEKGAGYDSHGLVLGEQLPKNQTNQLDPSTLIQAYPTNKDFHGTPLLAPALLTKIIFTRNHKEC